MAKVLNAGVAAVIAVAVLGSGGTPRANDAGEIVAPHMVGQALLAAHLVALAISSDTAIDRPAALPG